MQNTPIHPPIPTNLLEPPPIDARRDCEHFHGRALELHGLLHTAKKLPAPLVAVTGAPGAGKTSLLAEFRRQLPEHIARVKMEPEHFESDESLLSQIHQFLPCMEQFRRLLPSIFAHVMDVGATTIAKAGGFDIQIKAFRELLELRNLSASDPTKPLSLLSAAFPSGYIITLDEAQNLGRYNDLPLARRFLHALHENPNNENRPFGNGWMLLAGLNNVADILGKFGRYRISHTYSLSALGEDEAKAVLMDHMTEFLPQLSQPERDLVEQEWIPKLATRYHVWPHHLQGAATSLVHIVSHGYVTRDGFETILFYAEKHIQSLYLGITDRITNATFDRLSEHLALLAMRCHGVITPAMLWQLIQRVGGETNRDDMAHIAMKLQEIGLLQSAAEIPETGVALRHYRIPVPSLLTWIVNTAMLDDDDLAIAEEMKGKYGANVDAFFARHGIAE